MFTDRKSISEILNTQFKSVFTKKTSSKILDLPGVTFPSIKDLKITEFGVFKLLDKIDVSKASGPDCIPGRLLQNLARELAPVLHFIFEQSLNTGDLPAEWTLANVAPIFKKGSKLQAVNYRPVSLTCVAIPTDREFTSPSRYAISMVARTSSSLGVTCLGDPLVKLEYPTSLSNTN